MRCHFGIPVGGEKSVITLGSEFLILQFSLRMSSIEHTNPNAILVHFVNKLLNWLGKQLYICLWCRLFECQLGATKKDERSLLLIHFVNSNIIQFA